MIDNNNDESSQENDTIKIIESLGLVLQDEQRRKILEKIRQMKNYIPKIGILGKTGVGKSSLCNAIFGKKIAKTSDIEACTRKPEEIHVKSIDGTGGIILIDMPGVGEDLEHAKEYEELYAKMLPEMDIILWVIKGDDRALGEDKKVYNDQVEKYKKTIPIIFVINQVDKIEPSREWDEINKKPSPMQLANIHKKSAQIESLFNIASVDICALSADRKFGLYTLVERMVEVLPADKKVSILREAKKEYVSEKAKEEVTRGFFDEIKKYIGQAKDFYEKNKDAIHSAMGFAVKLFTKTRL
jgi:small GTP-binding protein